MVAAAREQVAKTGVPLEIIDRPGDAPALQVLWRCAQDIVQDAQRAADQIRIFQFPDSHRDVEAFADQFWTLSSQSKRTELGGKY